MGPSIYQTSVTLKRNAKLAMKPAMLRAVRKSIAYIATSLIQL
jgi:hypothetical protein